MSDLFGGMFGAGSMMGSFEARERERTADTGRRRSGMSDMSKEITISKEEFMEKASEVVANRNFAKAGIERDPKMGFLMMLMVTPIVAELAAKLFEEEEDKKNDGE